MQNLKIKAFFSSAALLEESNQDNEQNCWNNDIIMCSIKWATQNNLVEGSNHDFAIEPLAPCSWIYQTKLLLEYWAPNISFSLKLQGKHHQSPYTLQNAMVFKGDWAMTRLHPCLDRSRKHFCVSKAPERHLGKGLLSPTRRIQI